MIVREKLLYLVVRHCQLSCKNCGAGSEVAKPNFSDIKSFKEDLEKLSKFMKFNIFLLSGGEPLLHKELISFIKIAKNYNICKDLRIQTNGGLLYKQPDEFWELIDSLDLSLYPNSGIDNDEVFKYALEKCDKFNVKLLSDYKPDFIQVYYKGEPRDDEKIQTLYDNCGIRPEHAILDNGKLFKCVGPLVLKTISDGVDLIESEVEKYFNSSIPMLACRSCLALTGQTSAHIQIKAKKDK